MTLFKTKKFIHAHFIGIGGIGMSGLAEILYSQGISVSGSDLRNNDNIIKLREMGVKVSVPHHQAHIEGATVIVYSSAIPFENCELAYARSLGLRILRRAEMLSEVMRYKIGLTVAGSHGKTTTSSILATILDGANLGPSFVIGGVVSNLKGSARVGSSDYLVAEADESDGSFLLLNSVYSILTNIDDDHLDYHGCRSSLNTAFIAFLNKIPFYGMAILNISDSGVRTIIDGIKVPYITFALENKIDHPSHGIVPDYEARNCFDGICNGIEGISGTSGASFDFYHQDNLICRVELGVIGLHNIINALGAISLAYEIGVSAHDIQQSAKHFRGVGRRLEVLHETENLTLIDDYAHHPSEVLVTMKAIINLAKKASSRLIVLFEPHRYTRTRHCWEQFLHCFNGADEVFLLPIYAAGEAPLEGISSHNLVRDLNRSHPSFATALNGDEGAFAEVIYSEARRKEKSIVLGLGAGNIGRWLRKVSCQL